MAQTYTERRIELGQDVNNAWAIVAARSTGHATEQTLTELWNEVFPVVRKLSQQMREKEGQQ